MRIVHTKQDVRAAVAAARAEGGSIGLVPTMGALHEGHLSLVRGAVDHCDFVVVSIFVNPTQFGPGEDLDAYPRDLEGDAAKLASQGADLIFAPDPAEMYAADSCTVVSVEALTEGLCGAFRPRHFDGVTTVVCKLLNIVASDRAYFGRKDYQQLVVIRRMVRDLDMPVEVIGMPTVREDDGLALSSRNRYLTEREREVAPKLHEALIAGADAARQGATAAEVERIVAAELGEEPLFEPQYVRAVDADTLQPMQGRSGRMVIAVATYLGSTRLIDNVVVEG
ncbi:MAG: pantoate--beta-alanine ligase [Armatimonadota bacterium]|jgi:pantoate--beta-alanine ligase